MKDDLFRILVLDGGGSKGLYTLGILNELEKQLGIPIGNHFDLIYGTSTGSIIGALLALGRRISEIHKLYSKHIPLIMSQSSKEGKSQKLKDLGDQIFGEDKFDEFITNVGIVALNFDTLEPLIFKSNEDQSHEMYPSFIPGFGCTISDAVQASCSAYPIFDIKEINTINSGKINVMDGGYIANNATLYALIDADRAFKKTISNIRVLSLGTGDYIEKPIKHKGVVTRMVMRDERVQNMQRVLSASSITNVRLASLLYPNINLVRINETYHEEKYATNFIESDPGKLKNM